MDPIQVRHIEYCLPDRTVTNDELCAQNPSWNIDHIFFRTGISTRRWARDGETAFDLGHAAAQKALEKSNIPVGSIDALIFCTQSPDYIFPSNSSLLHGRLGLRTSVAAFDLNIGCSGFIYGLAIAKSMMNAFGYKVVLLVTAETYSRYSHPQDKSTRTLFGDGGAATLLISESGASDFIGFELGSDGKKWDRLVIPAGGARTPRSESTSLPISDIQGNIRSADNGRMDGHAIYNLVGTDVAESIRTLMIRNQVTVADFDLFLFHQASKVVLDRIEECLGVPREKTFRNLKDLGNIGPASLPILMKDAESAGKLVRGNLVLLASFGVGMSWGSCIVRW